MRRPLLETGRAPATQGACGRRQASAALTAPSSALLEPVVLHGRLFGRGFDSAKRRQVSCFRPGGPSPFSVAPHSRNAAPAASSCLAKKSTCSPLVPLRLCHTSRGHTSAFVPRVVLALGERSPQISSAGTRSWACPSAAEPPAPWMIFCEISSHAHCITKRSYSNLKSLKQLHS